MRPPIFSSAAVRNSEPILGVLRTELLGLSPVFEIGSGTGQHAVYFASAMPELQWQTSDLADNHEIIRARLAEDGLANVLPPMLVDMDDPPTLDRHYKAVFSSNTLHIMSMEAARKLVPFVATILYAGGRFCYYGAFRRGGSYNTPSNAAFHRALGERDARMGLRDLEEIDQMAAEVGLSRERLYAMPANNLLVSWVKRSTT